jgi:hypothetical protein
LHHVSILQEEHQEVLQGCQLATMRALLEQQVLPETAAVLATSDRNAQVIPTTGKDRVVPRILVPLVKVCVHAGVCLGAQFGGSTCCLGSLFAYHSSAGLVRTA